MAMLSCWKRLRLRTRRRSPRQRRRSMSPAHHRASTGTQPNSREESPCDVQDQEKTSPETPETLWDRAYARLRQGETAKLVSSYESLLAEELTDMQETESDATSNIGFIQKEKLEAIIEKGLKRMDQKSTTYTICGKQFDVRDQAAEAVHWLNQFKSFISEAVKVSSEASLAWAGVCVILPLFTNPSAQAKAQSSGFDYVASRMKFYAGFEKLLWPKRTEIDLALKDSLEKSLEKLYQDILKFHLTSVLTFFRDGFPQFTRDVFRLDRWDDMLARVKESEKTVTSDFKKLGDASILQELEKLSTAADEARGSWQQLISIATEQLHVQDKQLHVQDKQLYVQDEAKGYLQKIANKIEFASKLPLVHDALFESNRVFGQPQCQQNTRTGVIKHIMGWVENEEAPTLFWINGPAGIGKSTISRTLASTFRGQGRLAASYFFTRDRQGLKEVACFVPTLALQLAERFPEYRGKLGTVIENVDKAAITSRHSRLQFETLVSKPLQDAKNEGLRGSTQIIIVDALDECGHRQEDQQQQIADILRLIKRFAAIQTQKIRVILTSRKTPTIESSLEASTDDPLPYEHLAPQDVYKNDTTRDVIAYLRGVMDNLTLDPIQQETVIELATTPSPLFIYASTFCRFIKDDTRGRTPKTQLKRWLNSERGTSQLESVYLPVLEDAFQLDEEERKSGHLEPEAVTGRMIIGAVLLAQKPLSRHDLARLLQIDIETVHCWLQNLQAVFDVPQNSDSPVKLLHKSFSDFMFEQGACLRGPYQLDLKACHEELALACLRRMETDGLREDICDLQRPDIAPEKVDKRRIAECIPSDLAYATMFWVHHFGLSERRAQNMPRIKVFLKERLLYWLEALSFLRVADSQAIKSASALPMICSLEDPKGDSFIADAHWFILHNLAVFAAPLQMYAGALVFTPTGSQMRQIYKNHIPNWVTVISPMPQNYSWFSNRNWSWDPSYNAPIEKNHGAFRQLCGAIFAPRLSVLCSDGFVMICDTQNGEWLAGLDPRYDAKTPLPPIKQLDGGAADAFESPAESVFTGAGMSQGDCFTILSENGKILLSITSKRVIQSWDADSGARLGRFESSTCVLHAIAYAPDGQLLACEAGNHSIQIIDVGDRTGFKVRHTLCGDVDSIKWCGFSPNSRMLAVSLSAEIVVWDLSSGQRLKTFSCTGQWSSRMICFSPSSQYIAESSDEQIAVWDLGSENDNPCSEIKGWDLDSENDNAYSKIIATLGEDIPNPPRQLLFSQDSRFLGKVLGKVWKRHMQTWEIASGEPSSKISTKQSILAFEQRGHAITRVLTRQGGYFDVDLEAPSTGNDGQPLIPASISFLYPWILRGHTRLLHAPGTGLESHNKYEITMDSIVGIGGSKGIWLLKIETEDK